MNFIRSIRENLKDPKKKSITLLFIYFLFFIFVFAILNNAGSNNSSPIIEEETPLSVTDNYKSMLGYEYKITYTSNDIINVIDGTYYNNTSLFNYNGSKYYLDNEVYIIDNDSYYLTNIEYDISKLFNNNLSYILDSLTLISETTYTDGTIKKNYSMDANAFYKYYYEIDAAYTNVVNIEITEIDNYITNIVIDLTNLGINYSKIEVEYSNINNIKSLEFNKENYTYRE